MELRGFWRLFIQGDKSAFQRIYEQYADELHKYGMKLCNDHHLVIDCIHDLFVDLYGNHKIAREVNIRVYLISALRRRLFKQLKTTSNEVFLEENDSLEVEASPETTWIDRETEMAMWSRLKNELSRLTKRQQEILYLRFTLDLPYPEVAEIMNINIETCRKLSYRAMKTLKTNLQP